MIYVNRKEAGAAHMAAIRKVHKTLPSGSWVEARSEIGEIRQFAEKEYLSGSGFLKSLSRRQARILKHKNGKEALLGIRSAKRPDTKTAFGLNRADRRKLVHAPNPAARSKILQGIAARVPAGEKTVKQMMQEHYLNQVRVREAEKAKGAEHVN